MTLKYCTTEMQKHLKISLIKKGVNMEKLLGDWLGFYEDSNGCRASFFAAIENIAHGTFIGRAKDNIVEQDGVYTSVIAGKLDGDDVIFRKSQTSPDADIQFYYGKLGERKIFGTWYIQKDAPELGGKFEMWQISTTTSNKHFIQSDENLISSTETN